MMANLLTQEEVRLLAVDVGFLPRGAKIASAIAMCESPGASENGQATSDFGAIGDQDLANDIWGYSYGGFQIRSLRVQKGTGLPRDENRLLEPRFNCRSARIIRRNSGWEAWSTYTSGMYKAYLQDMFPPEPGTYVVVSGDTLSGIAAKHGNTFTWQDLAATNGIVSPHTITIGQVLYLPVQ